MTRDFDVYALKIAKLVASRGTCPRRQVGCITVDKSKKILSTGYNGVPSGYPHCTETPCGGHAEKSGLGLDMCMATHAEQNALLQCHDVSQIETIYCTTMPCIHCAKLICNTGTKRVVFMDPYKGSAADLFLSVGIALDQRSINPD
jgi:dCMP deaminase